jgi:hypothetical protein
MGQFPSNIGNDLQGELSGIRITLRSTVAEFESEEVAVALESVGISSFCGFGGSAFSASFTSEPQTELNFLTARVH